MRTFVSNGKQARWGAFGVLVGAAVSGFQASPMAGALAGLLAIPLYFMLQWAYVRWARVELSENQITGPSRSSLFKRTSFALSDLDSAKSARRSFFAKWHGYWYLYSRTGECMRVPCGLLGPENTEALMSALGLVSDETKWARRRTDIGWFFLAAWAVFAFMIQSVKGSAPNWYQKVP